MKKPNAAEVYYFIKRNIRRCENEVHINNCSKLIGFARCYDYAFIDDSTNGFSLCDLLQIKRVELIAEQYPVTE